MSSPSALTFTVIMAFAAGCTPPAADPPPRQATKDSPGAQQTTAAGSNHSSDAMLTDVELKPVDRVLGPGAARLCPAPREKRSERFSGVQWNGRRARQR
jgi:hypothetical protein